VGPYRIIYRLKPHRLVVVAVLHGARVEGLGLEPEPSDPA
jgi:hypothetical protein